VTGRTLAAAFVLLLTAQQPGGSSAQSSEPVTEQLQTFLSRLEQILTRGDTDAYNALLADAADRGPAADFASVELNVKPTRAVLRERDRRALPGSSSGRGYRLTADAFIEQGTRGRVATWQFDLVQGANGQWRIAAQHRLSSIGTLFKLAVNQLKQFDAHDFTIRSDDLALTLEQGSVFTVEADDRITGFILLGRGVMRFQPTPATERQQVRIFAGTETLETRFDTAFVRVGRTAGHVNMADLTERPVDPRTLRRADDVFRADGAKSFVLDLGDLSRDAWSLLPSAGDFVAEIDTKRFGPLTYAQSENAPEDITFFDRVKLKNIASYTSARALETHGRFFNDDSLKEYDVTDYRIDATYTPERRWFEGRAQLRVRVRSPVSQLRLRLAESLYVRSVTSEQDGRLFTLRVRGQDTVLIALPAVMLPGSELTLVITYTGRLNSQAVDRETLALQDNAPRFDLPGLMEPSYLYSNRSYWYPQPGISSFATGILRITVPEPFECVGSGTMSADSPQVADAERDARRWKTYEFVASRPLRYFSFIVARLLPSTRVAIAFDDDAMPRTTRRGPAVSGAVFDALDLSVNAIPRYERQGNSYAERAADIIQFYRSLIGDAPYSSFALAVVEGTTPGGHSPGYFATISVPPPSMPRTWRNDPASFDSFPEFVMAHEIAHQWWGQAVGWRNYHEQWLSEAFAQYFAALYIEHHRGRDAFQTVMRQIRTWAIEESDQGPVYLGYRVGHIRSDGRAFRAIVYDKGAAVLHMLRRFVGEEAFFLGLQRFYVTARYDKAGTEDFRQAMEAESGVALERFFDNWIYGSELPHLKVSYHTDPKSPGEAVVHVEQTAGAFDMPVTLTLQYSDQPNSNVILKMTSRIAELRVPLSGTLRGLELSRDDGTLGVVEK
jgi:hypothetical protein